MEVSRVLKKAIEEKNKSAIYSVLYTIAHEDPDFSTGKFEETLKYTENRVPDLYQTFDDEEFLPEEKWNKNYWAEVASHLMDNFCKERIEHLKKVGKKVYPSEKKRIDDKHKTLDYQKQGKKTEKQKKNLQMAVVLCIILVVAIVGMLIIRKIK